jgi:hypothetical protein
MKKKPDSSYIKTNTNGEKTMKLYEDQCIYNLQKVSIWC